MAEQASEEAGPARLLWRDGCPGGEDASQVGSRVDRLIGELRGLGGDAALFAHGHVLRVIAPAGSGCRPNRVGSSPSRPPRMACYEREVSVIRLWNDGSLSEQV